MFSVSQEDVEVEPMAIGVLDGLQLKGDSLDQEIRFWTAAYPSYRWHQIMMEASQKHKGHKNGGRMAILHLAIYDALASCEGNDQRSAVAAASHQIISYYFPEQQGWLDSLLVRHQMVQFTLNEYEPIEIQRGKAIGKAIATKYKNYAKTNNTDKIWDGKVPNDPSLWSGTPYPYGPTKKDWEPLTLTSAKQFRPGPPPKDWSEDMQELREFYKANNSSDIAWKWKSEPIWDQLLERKILEYALDAGEAAYVSAVFHAARYDATIAAWDGKYQYWGIRPFQYDTSFQPILETPNFPGYPAGHTTVAGALAKVLSHFFPHDAKQFEALAKECSESRFQGGVHFRTDNEVGLKVGNQVGQHVIQVFEEQTGKH
ncbi:Hypothetical protein I595_1839 [Croceitalea dokdonensis DOKDO 023]|uniref:Phosphatidic acid phosphatase type 2/haloperoxidase domain-containing protein n=1 Tax=Croceitalea dokdonensis DOKDO 023 TaxID=1300341 RepID=A0A0P7AW51_9FLAO|nr:vanadium-dependent haloperoxidase [Croceitalea dokdonensis]KPM32190.1 Hypothetical protein I595_1839 [Croceitalea dokdonensis DOKDO 023]